MFEILQGTILAACLAVPPGNVAAREGIVQHRGVVIAAAEVTLVIRDEQGGAEVFMISPDTSVLIDGKPAALEELLRGDLVTVTIRGEGHVLAVVCHRTRVWLRHFG